jgi:hypothetical protein
MNNMPSTVTELMMFAAKALELGDTERLEELQAHVIGWMQTDEERESQLTMLAAMIEAAFELNELYPS